MATVRFVIEECGVSVAVRDDKNINEQVSEIVYRSGLSSCDASFGFLFHFEVLES